MSTVRTVTSLMVIPRISAARASASAGSAASFTPPALPRPPTRTCALTTTGPPIRSAAARACAGVVATSPTETGTPWLARISLLRYSWSFKRLS